MRTGAGMRRKDGWTKWEFSVVLRAAPRQPGVLGVDLRAREIEYALFYGNTSAEKDQKWVLNRTGDEMDLL